MEGVREMKRGDNQVGQRKSTDKGDQENRVDGVTKNIEVVEEL